MTDDTIKTITLTIELVHHDGTRLRWDCTDPECDFARMFVRAAEALGEPRIMLLLARMAIEADNPTDKIFPPAKAEASFADAARSVIAAWDAFDLRMFGKGSS